MGQGIRQKNKSLHNAVAAVWIFRHTDIKTNRRVFSMSVCLSVLNIFVVFVVNLLFVNAHARNNTEQAVG